MKGSGNVMRTASVLVAREAPRAVNLSPLTSDAFTLVSLRIELGTRFPHT